MLALLAHAPDHVDAAHVVHRKNSHCHAEVVEGLVHGRRRRAFLNEELRFAHVGNHHAVADEPPAITDNDAYLPQLFRKSERSSDDLFAGFGAANNLHQAHHVCGAEEMQTDNAFRP